MSVIIREVGAPPSEWVYLDNTTNYTDRQSKRLTSNPIEKRRNVTDHSVKRDRTFSVAGSISLWDFHLMGGLERSNSDGFVAVTEVGSVVVENTVSDYLPSVVSQYTDFAADVKVADITLNPASVSPEDYLNLVKVKLQNLYDKDAC